MIEKRKVIEVVINQLNERIAEIQKDLVLLQESKNSETKSSAGDKYETGRAQAQIEIDKLRGSMLQFQGQLSICQRVIENVDIYKRVSLGSLITTTLGKFLILVNAGKLDLAGTQVFVISPESPMAKVLLNKEVGEWVILPNNTKVEVLNID